MSKAKILFVGDVEDGIAYTQYAQARLMEMRACGVAYLSRGYTFPDVEILIKIAPTGDKIFVTSTARVPVNAFVDTYPKIVFDPDTGLPKQQFLIDQQNIAEHRIPSVPPPTPPATDPPILLHAVRLIKTPQTLVNTNALPVEPQTPVTQDGAGHNLPTYPDQGKNKWREVYENFLPTKFTGHMRKLMQFAHGTGFWTDPTKVPVDYHYGNSFGLIKRNKAYYMVRITATQVYYVPSLIVINHVKDDHGITREVLQLKSGNLNKAVKIADISIKGAPWSTEIGWAFSYDTAEAAIVLDVGDQVGRNSYHATSLAAIKFGFDSQTGVPNGATVTQTAQKIFSNHHRMNASGDYGLFNIPVFSSEDGRASSTLHNESVDFGPSSYVGSDTNKPPSGYHVDGVPIHVWYAEGHGQQLCTYSYSSVPAQSFTTTGDTEVVYTQSGAGSFTSVKPRLDRGWSGTKAASGYVSYGFSMDGVPVPRSSGDKNSSYTSYMNRGGHRSMGSQHTVTDFNITYDATNRADPTQPIVAGHGYVGQGKVGMGLDIESIVTTEAGGGITAESSCTLSVLDRESALIASVSTSNQYAKTESSTVSVWKYYSEGDPTYNSTNTSGAAQFGPYDADIQRRSDEAAAGCGKIFAVRSVAISSDPLMGDVVIPNPNTTYSSPDSMTWVAVGLGFCDGSSITVYAGTEHPTTIDPAQYPKNTNTAASTTMNLTLCAGAQVFSLDPAPFRVNNRLFLVHPLDNSLAYRCTAAAFDPTRIAYDIGIGNAVVSIQNMKYPVENQLFGWVGVV